jgi:RND family efflux transporter MFP subunit
VKEGQVLARLDSREAELSAQREAINAKNAEEELERIDAIAELDAIARQEFDKQRFAVSQARANTKISAHQVAQRTLRAPFSGIITARRMNAGNFASTSTPIYDLADVSTLELLLHVPELEANGVHIGAPVEIETIDKTRFKAKIIRRAPIVDPTTGTVKFTAATDDYPEQAVPGAFARAEIVLSSKKDVPSLPNASIVHVEDASFVVVIVEGKAQRVPISLGLRGPVFSEVVSGLTPDAVIVQDPGEIANGTPLKSATEAAEGSAPAAPASETETKSQTDEKPSDAGPKHGRTRPPAEARVDARPKPPLPVASSKSG